MKKITACLLLTSSCLSEPECRLYPFKELSHYNVNPSKTTPNGIPVDPTKQTVDLELIDSLTDEVVQCLSETFPDGILPEDVRQQAMCDYESFDVSLVNSCIRIKIPDDWFYSCSNQQVLNVDADPINCEQKGITVTPECGCHWRQTIQQIDTEDYDIVVTPNLYIYKDALVRALTSCGNPWNNSSLAKCATPHFDP